MLDILKAIIIGIVEGISEFLPISSTGHIDLVSQFVVINQNADFKSMFEYVIQFGAILAVILLYFTKLNPFSHRKTAAAQRDTWSLWLKVMTACIPSILIGLPLNSWMDDHLHTPLVVATTLIVYGAAFIVIERLYRNKAPKFTSFKSISYGTALSIGCFQSLSIIPGTSRSGATILGGILIGADRNIATEFSFFLAIPTMVGVSILKIAKFLLNGNTFTGIQWAILGTGTLVSFLVAIIAIKWLITFVRAHDFTPFGWYRIILGLIVLLLLKM